MNPIFIHITTTGAIYASNQKEDTPASVLGTFRVNAGTGMVKIVTLTGSGNASAVALALSGAVATGKETEIVHTKS